MSLMSEEEGIRVLGSHWNRHKVRDEGTGITWNRDLNKWEARVVRNLGSFDNMIEAAAVLEKHLAGVEQYLLDEFLSDEDRVLLPPTAVYMDEKTYAINKQVSTISKRNSKKVSEYVEREGGEGG